MAEFRQQTEGQAFTVVDFFAEWCGPCKAIAPQVEQMAALHPHITFLKVFLRLWLWLSFCCPPIYILHISLPLCEVGGPPGRSRARISLPRRQGSSLLAI